MTRAIDALHGDAGSTGLFATTATGTVVSTTVTTAVTTSAEADRPLAVRAVPASGHALYFGGSDTANESPVTGPLFGHWHPAAAPRRGVGLIVCDTFGRESLSAYPMLRQLAIDAATAGFDVMRFDYPGCGDSAGDHDDPALVDAWIDSIGQAAAELRRLSGVTRFVFAGLRLGALLALQAAARRADVIGLLAIVPVLSGRSFLREARLLEAAAAGGAAQAGEVAPAGDAAGPGSLEAGGYLLSAQSCDALGSLDASRPVQAGASHYLVIERDDLPGQRKWLQRLTELGAEVRSLPLPGYAEMMQDPEFSRVPTAMLAAAGDWLRGLPQPARAAQAPFAAQAPSAAQTASVAQCSTTDPSSGAAASAGRLANWRTEGVLPGCIERIVTIDVGGQAIEAVLSVPRDSVAGPGRPGERGPRRALLLPNAGATRRSGPGRLYVLLARHFAARGFIVLRPDLSGLGDTPPRRAGAMNVVYPPEGVDEVVALAGWLKEHAGGGACTSMGLCSGAYHSLKAAARGAPLTSVVAINPLTFFWHDGDDVVPDYKTVRELNRYRQTAFDGARWLKLLRGQVDVRHLLRLIRGRLRTRLRNARKDVMRAMRLPLHEDLAQEIGRMLERRIAVQFVVARSDPGAELLREQGGRPVRRWLMRRRIGLDFVEDADHTFTREAARQRLLARLDALLDPTIQ